jgi:hypothetical protein
MELLVFLSIVFVFLLVVPAFSGQYFLQNNIESSFAFSKLMPKKSSHRRRKTRK